MQTLEIQKFDRVNLFSKPHVSNHLLQSGWVDIANGSNSVKVLFAKLLCFYKNFTGCLLSTIFSHIAGARSGSEERVGGYHRSLIGTINPLVLLPS